MTSTLEPGPMRVEHGAFTTKAEVLDQLRDLDFWPTTYVSDRMDALTLHWHPFDNVGFVLEGRTSVLDADGQRIPLGPGDKLVIPAGAVHAEGEVTERTVYIVGIPMAANLLEVLEFNDPATSPLRP